MVYSRRKRSKNAIFSLIMNADIKADKSFTLKACLYGYTLNVIVTLMLFFF